VPPPVLYRRIEARVRAQVGAGLLDEARALMDRGLSGWLTSSQAIGYAEMVEHLSGHVTLEEAVARTAKRTKSLARRQLAWFRRDPRIRWFETGEDGALSVALEIEEYLVHG
jgi:tRNA dimethylallyltransferase